MSESEEYLEESSESEYVTKDELRSMLAEFLGGGSSDDKDDDSGWEIVEDFTDGVEDFIEGITSADVERIAEEKVQAALAKLTAARKPAKSAPAKKAAAPKPEPEVEPTVKSRRRFGASLWGE